MVRVMLAALVLIGGLLVAPMPVAAEVSDSCTQDLMTCYTNAAKIDGFWARWAAGLDCELNYAECVRVKLVG